LESLPDVVSASLSKSEPARDWSDRRSVFYPGQEPPPDVLRSHPELGLLVDANRITPGYFRTLGIALAAGRDFKWSDRDTAAPVAIVSQSLAQRLWPGQNAVGKRISAPHEDGPRRPPLEIVGVAADAKYRSILSEPPLLLYEPQMQYYDSYLSIAVRTKGDPALFAPALRRATADLDRNLPLYDVRKFSDQVRRSLWQQRSAAALIGAFGVMALVLAALGLYSQLQHSVVKRAREIGIRMALGADPRALASAIVRRAASLVALGAAAGLLTAVPLTPLIESRLYGVSARDPVTFGTAGLVLMLLAIVASYLPARAAMRVDPMSALRAD
jgi:predicted permease